MSALPWELVLHVADCVDDKATLLALRLVCKALHKHLKSFRWHDHGVLHTITIAPRHVRWSRGQKLFRDITLEMGGYSLTDYSECGAVEFCLQSDHFTVKRCVFGPDLIVSVNDNHLRNTRSTSAAPMRPCTIC